MEYVENIENNLTYAGNDLGANYTEESTLFKLWAPLASRITLCLYQDGHRDTLIRKIWMEKTTDGIWRKQVAGDLHGIYYTYKVITGKESYEVVDPYAKAVGLNEKRGMVVDLVKTNPQEWAKDNYIKLDNKMETIIYELHLRDFSIHQASGIKHKGKYLALAENVTKNKEGFATGLAHLKELGVTHIHLLPVFDFNSVDEKVAEKASDRAYNWGYDPENYNVPEGSYTINPVRAVVRILEFKQMVKAIHEAGMGVVMDVVYNHTAKGVESNLNRLAPNYYHRVCTDGTFSNGSGCGNEIASERKMVSKFILDSVTYWAKEYHVDGFRFDLMGLMDMATMEQIHDELIKINPECLLYGEGWTGGESLLNEEHAALKKNMPKLPTGIACFNDDMRDAIKGSVQDATGKGYVNGAKNLRESIKFGIVGAIEHPQVVYSEVNYSKAPWAKEPTQTITYSSCHDNLTLFDKLQVTGEGKTREEIITSNKMAATLVLTSQGIPFLHAGEELLRSKVKEDGTFDENSYKSSDKVNAINWQDKTNNREVFEYYKGLIALRKEHIAFRIETADAIRQKLTFLTVPNEEVIAYQIAKYERDNIFCVIFNPTETIVTVDLPRVEWYIVVDKEKVNLDNPTLFVGDKIQVGPMSWFILMAK